MTSPTIDRLEHELDRRQRFAEFANVLAVTEPSVLNRRQSHAADMALVRAERALTFALLDAARQQVEPVEPVERAARKWLKARAVLFAAKVGSQPGVVGLIMHQLRYGWWEVRWWTERTTT